MKKSQKHSAARWRYVVLLSLEDGRPAHFLHEDFVAAKSGFFFYFAFMKNRTRLPVTRYEHLRINRCELHQICNAPVFSIENLNTDTLLRSSDKPFTSFELKNSPFLPTLH